MKTRTDIRTGAGKKNGSYPGNSSPCQGAGAYFLRGLRLLYQTCTDWIATAETVEVNAELHDQNLTWINNAVAKSLK